MQLIDFIETDRNLKVATTNYDTVPEGRGRGEGSEDDRLLDDFNDLLGFVDQLKNF